MAEAKESDETTRADALKQLYSRKKETAKEKKDKAEQTKAERDAHLAVSGNQFKPPVANL